MLESLSIGIIAGVLSTGAWLLIAIVWRKLLVPWYEEQVYRDAKIEGRWKGEVETKSGATFQEMIIVKRQGHRVLGTIQSVAGTDEGGDYTFEGVFRNLILSAVYSTSSDKRLDRGSFTMMLKKNGQVFEGTAAYYSDDRSVIDAYASYKWTREDGPKV